MARIAPEVEAAINAFRENERTRLLADKKNKTHNALVRVMALNCDRAEREVYFIETEKILAEYEEKRRKAGL